MKKVFYKIWKISIRITLFLALILWGCASQNQSSIPIGKKYDEKTMESIVNPPKKIPLYLRLIIWIADKKAHKKMITGRILSWLPKVSISSGLLELGVEDDAATTLDKRLIKMLRIEISYTVPSPFAIDINSQNYENFDITKEEIEAFQGLIKIDSVSTFSKKEKIALEYANQLSKTPVMLSQDILDELRYNFTEREIVAIASLTAKVNYWARLMESLRIKPAGYTNDSILDIEKYNTLKKSNRRKIK